MTPRPHRACRTDANQQQIIADLRALGFYVQDLSALGGEVLDLLCFWRGVCLPVEVKQSGHFGDLTQGERNGMCYMRLCGVDPIVATCAKDVVRQWSLCANSDAGGTDSHTTRDDSVTVTPGVRESLERSLEENVDVWSELATSGTTSPDNVTVTAVCDSGMEVDGCDKS